MSGRNALLSEDTQHACDKCKQPRKFTIHVDFHYNQQRQNHHVGTFYGLCLEHGLELAKRLAFTLPEGIKPPKRAQ